MLDKKQWIVLFFMFLTEEIQGASSRHFLSGAGLTLGLGLGRAQTKSTHGAGDGNVSEQNIVAPIGFANPLIYVQRTITLNYVNCTPPASSINNRSGLAFSTGALAQHVSIDGMSAGALAQHVSIDGMSAGVRWIYERTRAHSTADYASGPFKTLATLGPDSAGTLNRNFNAQSTQRFCLKDSYFTAVIFELGYAYQRTQGYLGPGIAFHHQKLSCLTPNGDTIGMLSKNASSPMLALGACYAITQNISLGLEKSG